MWLATFVAAGMAFVAALFGSGLMLRILRRRAILDHPVERSSHAVPTPTGGGIAVVASIIVIWLAAALMAPALPPERVLVVLAATAALAGLSWLDDLRGVAVGLRLAVQALAVALGLLTLPPQLMVFQGLVPPWADLALSGLAWLWFVNLYNFMDGIDGISGAESAAIGGGIVLLAAFVPLSDLALPAALVAAAALGFLYWNWSPARLFLGDVGAVPLGFIIAWLLLSIAARGYWAPALILPLYYLADATITLGRRTSRGERLWQAHRSHFYQLAAVAGGAHAPVVRRIVLLDLVLCGLAVAALDQPLAALIAAAIATALLLWYFARQQGGIKEQQGG